MNTVKIKKIKMPIGYSDFKKLIDNECDFVDKTLFIKDIIDDGAEVILITRPRRFGKTLNLSMLRYFFEKPQEGQDNKYLFDNFKIMQKRGNYLEHQGKHPVISITFKDIKDDNFNDAYKSICKLLSQLYACHEELLSSDKLLLSQKKVFESILEGKVAKENVKTAIQDLTVYLNRHYGEKPVILLDEYDTPIQAGYTYGYYQEIVNFMRGFFGSSLKDNTFLHKAVLIGILRVAKENIFSGLNNLKVCSVLDQKYSEYFGFIESEINDLLQKTDLMKHTEAIKNWYNGYQFGTNTIYNPWSIINCISEEGILKPYWVNTSDNALIKDLIANSDRDFRQHFEMLLSGKELQEYIDPNIIYSSLQGNEASIWTLLLMSGYLKVTSCMLSGNKYICTLQIPNKEVLCLYDDIVKDWLFGHKNLQWYRGFLDSIRKGDLRLFAELLQEITLDTLSCFDLGGKQPENFFHGFTMGLIASLRDEYYTDSNKESGYGRYDLALLSKKNPKLASYIFEFKSVESESKLEKTASDALTQIEIKKYSSIARKFGLQKIYKVGIVFCGKKVVLTYRKESIV